MVVVVVCGWQVIKVPKHTIFSLWNVFAPISKTCTPFQSDCSCKGKKISMSEQRVESEHKADNEKVATVTAFTVVCVRY